MRTIRFRGKSREKNEWVHGMLTYHWDADNNDFAYAIQEKGRFPCIVHPESVGQFTGLTDKNLIDIYENDKLINPEGKVGLVVYYDGRFRLQIHKSETSVHYIDLSQGFCNNKAIK